MLAARRVSNRAVLKPEPAAGSTGTTALRIRLPDGSTHMRKFASEASLQVCHSCGLLQRHNSQIAACGLLSRKLHGWIAFPNMIKWHRDSLIDSF